MENKNLDKKDKKKGSSKPESLTAAEYSSVGINYHDIFYNGQDCGNCPGDKPGDNNIIKRKKLKDFASPPSAVNNIQNKRKVTFTDASIVNKLQSSKALQQVFLDKKEMMKKRRGSVWYN